MVARSIPLAELEALRDTLVTGVTPGPEAIVSVLADPVSGFVLIGIVTEGARDRAEEAIEAATGRPLYSLPVDIGVTAGYIEEDSD